MTKNEIVSALLRDLAYAQERRKFWEAKGDTVALGMFEYFEGQVFALQSALTYMDCMEDGGSNG